MKVVHLPVYEENAYQPLLMKFLTTRGVVVIRGGGGGNFLRTALFRWRADIYHFHWLNPYLLRPAWFSSVARAIRFLVEVALLRLSGARIVWTVHNLVNHERRFPKLERFYTSLFTRFADSVIAHSQNGLRAADQVFRLGNRTLKVVIPQGSYTGHYPNRMSREECRATLEIKLNELVFLFLGCIKPYKGVAELIRCFKQVPGDVRLLIAGRVYSSKLLKLLNEAMDGAPNIRLYDGFVPDNALQIYFNAADVYVLPVRDILNSGSISLAMSFGLPCIAPRLGGLPDTLGEDGGILYDPAQPEGLLGALQLAVQRRNELSQSGRQNFQRAKQWTFDEVADRTLEVYRQCLAHQ